MRRRAPGALAIALVVAALAAGCGGDDEPEATQPTSRPDGPAHTIYLLDTSLSMQGGRIATVREAMAEAAATMQPGERVTVIPFSTEVGEPRTWEGAGADEIRAYVDGLEVDEDTAIYDALEEAYRQAEGGLRDGRVPKVVVLSDGEVTRGDPLDGFFSFYRGLPEEVRAVPTYPVVIGEAPGDEMEDVAELTGGRTFDGDADLAGALAAIRGQR